MSFRHMWNGRIERLCAYFSKAFFFPVLLCTSGLASLAVSAHCTGASK